VYAGYDFRRTHAAIGAAGSQSRCEGLFDGREIGTAFYKGQSGEQYNPDFAAWARACGADGMTVTKPQDLKGAIERAIKNKRPCVIDVHVDANVRPPSTGTWQLPPIPYKEPIYGKPHAR
jgi:acetolactate synthase-1/2/3 large subunit